MASVRAFLTGALFTGYCVGSVTAWREGGTLCTRIAWTLFWPVLMIPNVFRYHQRKRSARFPEEEG